MTLASTFKFSRSLLAFGFFVLYSTGSTIAQHEALLNACTADIKAKCSGIAPGDGRIKACVNEHLKEFSEECQLIVTRIARVGKACKADFKTYCATAKPGDDRRNCIKAHLKEFSRSCKESLDQAAAGKSY
jgi:hypothetical protein